MSTSRRRFLKSGALATLFAGIYLGSPQFAFGQNGGNSKDKKHFETPYEAKLDPVFNWTKATFEPHLKTDFNVHAGRIVTALTLIEVKDCPRIAAPKSTMKTSGECYSLLFHADRELSPLQTIYKLEHGALGKFSLFVTRIVKNDDREGLYYEAVINRVQPN
ncbi:MAG TPA: hypothetical protein VF666_16195 [Pyrinomonadaceae bacterium]